MQSYLKSCFALNRVRGLGAQASLPAGFRRPSQSEQAKTPALSGTPSTRSNRFDGLVWSQLGPYIHCSLLCFLGSVLQYGDRLTNNTLLELKDVTARYGDVQVLWGVTFAVREAEIATLVGANGAGKSTTLKTISGVVRADGGQIFFAGERIDRLPAHEIAGRGVAHVPEGRRLFPLMSVKENLEMGAVSKEARRLRAKSFERIFELFPKLRERERQMAGTLSGGEQQMVAIARGLMARPRLLILDEPSLGLAPIIVREMFEIIETINREGITVLLVEQNVHQSLRLASRAYVLENGRVVLEGAGSELLDDERVREAYLGA